MKISIIVAIAENGAIGKDGDLLWHISEDLKHFKKITTGHTVVMGRKTWESLPIKPLPNRRNIVLTNNKNYIAEGAEVFFSVEGILESCKKEEEIFCMGGGMLYKEMLPLCNTLYLTQVSGNFDADTFFPEINFDEWRETFREEHPITESCPYSFAFVNYERK